MQQLKRLEDLLEFDAERIDQERRGERRSNFEMQIDATEEEIREAFRTSGDPQKKIRARLGDQS